MRLHDMRPGLIYLLHVRMGKLSSSLLLYSIYAQIVVATQAGFARIDLDRLCTSWKGRGFARDEAEEADAD